MKILVFDNYDSFTYNLVHIIRDLGFVENMDIFRNDKINLEAVSRYDKILLSPGPSLPKDAGIMLDLIRTYSSSKSILGICLGHQGIAEVFNARLFNMPLVLHGVTTRTKLLKRDEKLFKGLPESFAVCRYHSWAVIPESVNGELLVTAVDEDGTVMGIRHKTYDVQGLQFHPEAYLTENGRIIIENWLTN